MRLRVLPLVIVAFSATVMIKASDLWSDLGLIALFDFDGIQTETAVVDPGRPPRPAIPSFEEELSPTAGTEGDEADPESDATGSGSTVHDPFDLSDEEIELLEQLATRREALAQRARELEQRAALLQAAEGRIEDKITDLKALQAIIEGLLVKHDEQEEAQMRSLVKIYESMKPKDAARIFEGLDMVVLLDVIGRMKERKSAPILAKMNPDKAKAVTIELAQRRELPIARD